MIDLRPVVRIKFEVELIAVKVELICASHVKLPANPSTLLTTCLGLVALCHWSCRAAADTERFEAARQTTIRWMQTRKINSTIREWSDQKQALGLASELLNKEIELLDGQIKQQGKTPWGKTKRDELDAKLKSRNELLDYAAKRLGAVEAKIAGLAGLFPPVLSESVEPLLKKFPSRTRVADPRFATPAESAHRSTRSRNSTHSSR